MKLIFSLILLGIPLILFGCGGPKGLTLEGTVTFAGQPLSQGYITFEPEAGSGTTGTGATVPIQDGKFVFGPKNKLSPGHYVVRISPASIGSEANLQTAPPQFQPWQQKIDLQSDQKALSFDVPAEKK